MSNRNFKYLLQLISYNVNNNTGYNETKTK